MSPIPIIPKVVAYVTHGSRLLVFRHIDFPEAGIQVPAGTIEEGEEPETAVLREAFEETGLDNLNVAHFLGRGEIDMRPYGKREIHIRYFYHLQAEGDVAQRWLHDEVASADGPTPITFSLYWVDLPDKAPCLAAGQGWLLGMLDEFL